MTEACERCGAGETARRVYARGLCRLHYDRATAAGTLAQHARLPRLPENCAVDGCERPRVKQARGRYRYCSAHKSRLQRQGDVCADQPVRTHTPGPWATGNGYLDVAAAGHPMAGQNGHARQHRVVLFDAIGPGAHPCHWCGMSVTWDLSHPASSGALTVDHVDHDRTNTALSNLVPSCHPCNARRTSRWAS